MMELTLAALGSSLIGVIIAYWLNRHRAKAELTRLHVDTALLLEERVYERYTSVAESLSNAEKSLTSARQEMASAKVELDKARGELAIQDKYIQKLIELLKAADVPFPPQSEFA